VPPLREILPRQGGAAAPRAASATRPPAAATPGSRSPATTDDRALSLRRFRFSFPLALASAFLAGSLRPLSDTFWLLWSPTRPPGAQPLTPGSPTASMDLSIVDLAGPGGRDRRRRVREHGDSRGAGRAARLLAVLGRRASRHGRSPGRDDSPRSCSVVSRARQTRSGSAPVPSCSTTTARTRSRRRSARSTGSRRDGSTPASVGPTARPRQTGRSARTDASRTRTRTTRNVSVRS